LRARNIAITIWLVGERKSRLTGVLARSLPASVIIIGLLDTPANYRSAAAKLSRDIYAGVHRTPGSSSASTYNFSRQLTGSKNNFQMFSAGRVNTMYHANLARRVRKVRIRRRRTNPPSYYAMFRNGFVSRDFAVKSRKSYFSRIACEKMILRCPFRLCLYLFETEMKPCFEILSLPLVHEVGSEILAFARSSD